MKCTYQGEERKLRYETPPGSPTDTPQPVTYVTKKWKCSKYSKLLENEETEDTECEDCIAASLNPEPEQENREEEDKDMVEIREGWVRFLK